MEQESPSSAVNRRVFKAFAAQGFGQVVSLLTQITSIPLYLHFWGKETYGEWLVLSTIPACIGLTDLGFASAAANEMTMLVSGGNKQGALRVFHSTWSLLSLVSIGATLFSIAAAAILPGEHWFGLSDINHRGFVEIVAFLVLQVIFQQQRAFLYAGYQCDGLYARSLFLANLTRLTELAATALILGCGGKMVACAAWLLVTRIFESLLMMVDLGRMRPWLTLGFRHADRDTIRRLFFPAIAFLSLPISNAINLQGTTVVIGLVCGPTSVADFSVFRTMTRIVYQASNTIANTIGVEITMAFGRNDIDRTRRFHEESARASLWMSIILGILVGLFAQPIIHIWTSREVRFNPLLFYGLLIDVVLSSLWLTSSSVLTSTNRHKRMAIFYVTLSGLSMLVAAVSMTLMGISGVALSLLFVDAGMTWYTIRHSTRMLNGDARQFIQRLLVPPVDQLAAIYSRLVTIFISN